MVQALVFDIDGVLIRMKKRYTETLDTYKYHNPVNTLHDFYNGKSNENCDKGFNEATKEILPYLEKINWKGSCQKYLLKQYKYEKQFIDNELLKTIEKINKKQISCFIASNQNSFRKAFLIKNMKIGKRFKKAVFSCDIGFIKSEKAYWDVLFHEVKKHIPEIQKESIMFMDDYQKNIETAKEFGIQTRLISSREDIIEVIKETTV